MSPNPSPPSSVIPSPPVSPHNAAPSGAAAPLSRRSLLSNLQRSEMDRSFSTNPRLSTGMTPRNAAAKTRSPLFQSTGAISPTTAAASNVSTAQASGLFPPPSTSPRSLHRGVKPPSSTRNLRTSEAPQPRGSKPPSSRSPPARSSPARSPPTKPPPPSFQPLPTEDHSQALDLASSVLPLLSQILPPLPPSISAHSLSLPLQDESLQLQNYHRLISSLFSKLDLPPPPRDPGELATAVALQADEPGLDVGDVRRGFGYGAAQALGALYCRVKPGEHEGLR
ncbi:hypothetical protein TeGR_g14337 [Tetraparma gracilis]|uniref:Uncharacterized protein n=1 Tax=Tetraparma gracilis TaxID=2962635 RepID=A0ABQ6N6L4_9STRA|nr:hypothetical protein TeGR_g14337 [Tetraparma gracilis]